MITEEEIKNLKYGFDNYIKLLKSLKSINKAEINDLYINEETLRIGIIKILNELKEIYF